MTCSPIRIQDAAGRTLFSRAWMPQRFQDRARGLIGHPSPQADEAWWFVRCSAIHSIGMRFSIDVVHLDTDGRVLSIKEWLAPLRLSWHPAGCHVIEMQAGRASALGLRTGQRLQSVPCA
jgi:uncharacterized protein